MDGIGKTFQNIRVNCVWELIIELFKRVPLLCISAWVNLRSHHQHQHHSSHLSSAPPLGLPPIEKCLYSTRSIQILGQLFIWICTISSIPTMHTDGRLLRWYSSIGHNVPLNEEVQCIALWHVKYGKAKRLGYTVFPVLKWSSSK